MKAIADTGLIVAFGNRRDRFHEWACDAFRRCEVPLLTCDVVLAEAAYHLHNAEWILKLLEAGVLSSALDLGSNTGRLQALGRQFSDQRPDLADLCVVRLSELHPHHTVITTDARDFRVYRRNGRERIPLLLPPELQ